VTPSVILVYIATGLCLAAPVLLIIDEAIFQTFYLL